MADSEDSQSRFNLSDCLRPTVYNRTAEGAGHIKLDPVGLELAPDERTTSTTGRVTPPIAVKVDWAAVVAQAVVYSRRLLAQTHHDAWQEFSSSNPSRPKSVCQCSATVP